MKPVRTRAIVLRRTQYGEADRIVQFVTSDYGKISAIAKGARREKSKLAGGIELLSVSEVVLVAGRGSLWTLTSAKMDTFFMHIVQHYNRLQCAYEAIRHVSRATEHVEDAAFFVLLETTLRALDDATIELDIVVAWFWLQLAILQGQGLNLATDINGMNLVEGKNYHFNTDEMAFVYDDNGDTTTEHIKLLRLLSAQTPDVVARVKDIDGLLAHVRWLVEGACRS